MDTARTRTSIASALPSAIFPGEAGYDDLRRSAFRWFDTILPSAIVVCSSDSDVAAALGFARDEGMPVAPRGGGHCFAGRSSTHGIQLDLRQMRSVEVGDDGLVEIGAGARLEGVYRALQLRGLTIPAGCGPTVGIAGLTLGGGLGLIGRRYGLTCDRLVSARVVLVDGTTVECDETREPELFWALRGAGGAQFGIVTSLTFATVPAPHAVRVELAWDAPSGEVVAGWQRWAPDVADDVTIDLKLAARGGRVQAIAFGAVLGDEADAKAAVGELVRAIGREPHRIHLDPLPFDALKRSMSSIGAADAAEDTAADAPASDPVTRSELFEQNLPDHVIEALLEGLVAADAPANTDLDFTAMGGAYNRVDPTATAFVHRSVRFMLQHIATDPADRPEALRQEWVTRSWETAHSWASGGVYPNFPDPLLDSWSQAYWGDNGDRLGAVKRRYDPGEVLRSAQSMRPH